MLGGVFAYTAIGAAVSNKACVEITSGMVGWRNIGNREPPTANLQALPSIEQP
jgi:hypothetical protein